MKKFTVTAAVITGLIASPLFAEEVTAEVGADIDVIAVAADESTDAKVDVTADAKAGTDGAAVIAEADIDGNGTYSFEELKSVYPELTEEEFAKVDSNVDGEADADEIQAALEATVLIAG